MNFAIKLEIKKLSSLVRINFKIIMTAVNSIFTGSPTLLLEKYKLSKKILVALW